MSTAHPWPNSKYLNPPPRYTSCWRCGIRTTPDTKQRACRDCLSLLAIASERDVWATD